MAAEKGARSGDRNAVFREGGTQGKQRCLSKEDSGAVASSGAVKGASGIKCRTPRWWHGARQDAEAMNGADSKSLNGTSW